MSARGRGTKKTPYDEHLTRPSVARACMQLVDPRFRLGSRPERLPMVLDSSAGTGRFPDALFAVHGAQFHVDAVEVQRRFEAPLRRSLDQFEAGGSLHLRRFEDVMQRGDGYDFVTSNPPFDAAEAHIRHGIYHLATGGRLMFLLRLHFRAGQGRRDLFSQLPLFRCYVFESRPSFHEDDDDTDAAEYALFVWQKGYTGPEIVRSFNHTDPVLMEQDAARIRALDWTCQNPEPR